MARRWVNDGEDDIAFPPNAGFAAIVFEISTDAVEYITFAHLVILQAPAVKWILWNGAHVVRR